MARQGAADNTLKQQILTSAVARFTGPGYGKTTMDEIAADCDISPAHLYNFFKNKLDLAVSVAEQMQENLAELLRGHLQQPGDVMQTLEEYFQAELAENYRLQQDYPGMSGLLDLIRKKRPMAVEGFRLRLLKDLSLFLDKAMRNGQLLSHDPFWLAESLQLATFPFRHLVFPTEKPLPDMQRDLSSVLKIVGEGIKKPPAGKAGG